MPQSTNDGELAEKFADFFMDKIAKIRKSLQDFPSFIPNVKQIQPLENFEDLTETQVKSLICELNTKSCELDLIPKHILKSHLDELLPTITKLVNLSLSKGVFPTHWKQEIVRPLLKKSGLELQLSNYRPVSNLSFLSKLIEKAALFRLNNHVDTHNLLPKNQSAYRRHHSCETALLRLVNDLLDGMEKQEVTALIAIDLSAAFDTVDHDILLDVLQSVRCQWYRVSLGGLVPATSWLSLSDCKEVLDVYPEAESGFYEIELWKSKKKLIVNCDMETDGGGWTIFHRRFDGSIDFYRNITEYENGFGIARGELWLGLKYIQELADQNRSEARLDVTNHRNEIGYETFQEFKLTNGTDYRLNIGLRNASGNLVEGLAHNNLAAFSTFDRDLDSKDTGNCAVDRHGGWWYDSCTYANLNGLYAPPGTICQLDGADFLYCGHWHGGFQEGPEGDTLRKSSMMLRRT
ncbi:angiopoietin-2-like [Ruditapes philippinarum]|uniref:angiopoietin-2-like n=1 Tax=Ruditapes philippinarum TaxID=129788 RepID=UPI00295B5323|nr:angiopoietin-2-like [Ruditapes philippinarum]